VNPQLKKIAKRVLAPLFKLTADRDDGFETEVRVWDRWFEEKGSRAPGDYRREDYRYRTDPAAAIEGWHRELVDKIASDRVSILDVGAGPVTVIGKSHDAKVLRITAVDPLADEYAKLLAKHRLEPPVRTRKGSGEELVALFGRDAFDLVLAQKCIDHSIDPAGCVRNMIEVCRVGGVVALAHEENLAVNAAYRGLHQWNFNLRGSSLIVSGGGYTKNLDEEFRGRLRWEHRRDGALIRSWSRKLA
jgi:SAM-dependent methyltransferase